MKEPLLQVRLKTADHRFVADVSILPMEPLPEVLMWGSRTFVVTPADEQGLPLYVEGMCFAVDGVEAVFGVSAVKRFDFGQALRLLRRGRRVRRMGWNGAGMWVEQQNPDEHSKMRRPYLFMKPVDGQLVPWVASQSDLLADDWELAE